MKAETQSTLITAGLIAGGLFIAKVVLSALGGVSTVAHGGVKPIDQKYLKDKYTRWKDFVKALTATIDVKNLREKLALQKIAETQRAAMMGAGTDEETLFKSLKGLNGDELKAVLIYFGLTPSQLDPLGYSRRDLIDWYRKELSGKALTDMQTIWKETGLFN